LPTQTAAPPAGFLFDGVLDAAAVTTLKAHTRLLQKLYKAVVVSGELLVIQAHMRLLQKLYKAVVVSGELLVIQAHMRLLQKLYKAVVVSGSTRPYWSFRRTCGCCRSSTRPCRGDKALLARLVG